MAIEGKFSNVRRQPEWIYTLLPPWPVCAVFARPPPAPGVALGLSHALRGLGRGWACACSTAPRAAWRPRPARLLARLSPALGDIPGRAGRGQRFSRFALINVCASMPAPGLRAGAGAAGVRFLARHPGMQVELVADDALVDIVAAGFDAGVRFGERLQQEHWRCPSARRSALWWWPRRPICRAYGRLHAA